MYAGAVFYILSARVTLLLQSDNRQIRIPKMCFSVDSKHFVCASVGQTSSKRYGKANVCFVDFAGYSVRICMSAAKYIKTGYKLPLAVFYASLAYFLVKAVEFFCTLCRWNINEAQQSALGESNGIGISVIERCVFHKIIPPLALC